VQGYQAQMLDGAWSVSGEGLKGSTVNQRVLHACNFLQWASDRGLRSSFEVVAAPVRVRADSATSVHGHKGLRAMARAGAVRQAPASLRMPTDEEVAKWLVSVRIERGATKALMCELVLASGMRREEVVQWRVDTLPEDRSDWHVIRRPSRGTHQARHQRGEAVRSRGSGGPSSPHRPPVDRGRAAPSLP